MNDRIQHLFQLCLSGNCNEQEREELARHLTSLSEEEAGSLLQAHFEKASELTDMDSATANSILKSIVRITEKKKTPVFSIKKLAAVAGVLLILTFSVFYFNQKSTLQNNPQVAKIEKRGTQAASANGNNKSTLTLSDGTKIILDSAGVGSVAEESGIKIIKMQDGSLEYVSTGNTSLVTYNTLYNPPGGNTIRLTLEDGSLVLLNAASSVVFPTAFVGKERKIEMEGEIYLEVARNKELPFYVVTDKLEIQVLGTEFNVKNYYDDKNLEVTLKEGKVAVHFGRKRYELNPGNQLSLNNKSEQVKIETVNVADVISWKEGFYTFKGSTLSEITKTLKRWYDTPINIENIANAELLYTAIVYKKEPLEKFMNRLEESSDLKCVRIGNAYYIR